MSLQNVDENTAGLSVSGLAFLGAVGSAICEPLFLLTVPFFVVIAGAVLYATNQTIQQAMT